MNRRVCLGAGALLTACLLAAVPRALSQEPHARVPFEGSHTFRNMLHLHGLKPLASPAELAKKPPHEAVLIVFGDPRGIDEAAAAVGELKAFRSAGGAILIATDRPTWDRLLGFGLEVSGRAVLVNTQLRQDPPVGYQDNEDCPLLYGLGNVRHPIFQGLWRGLATNRPSFLRRDFRRPALPGRLLPLAHFAGCVVEHVKNIPPDGLTFIAAPAQKDDRVLVIAGHGIFMNGMLALDTDNFPFAWNCLAWLAEKGRRKYALFIEDGRVVSSFDVPLVQLPLPPLRVVSAMLRGLEEENFFNKLVLDNVPRERWLRYLFLGASGLLLLFGLFRLVRAHHRGEMAAPRVAANLERQATAAPSLAARRAEAALRAGNCYEAARTLARLAFEDEGGEPRAAPPAAARGGRRLRRDVERLWELAYGTTATPVSLAEFAGLVAQAERVRAALQRGALRFESS